MSLKHKVSVIHTFSNKNQAVKYKILQNRVNDNLVELIVSYKSSLNVFKYFQSAKAFYKAYKIAKKRGTITHNFLNVFYPLGIHYPWFKFFSRSKWYALEHWTGYHFNGAPSKRHLGIAQYISHRCQKVLPVSEDLGVAMRSVGIKNISDVVYNVVDTDLFKPSLKKDKSLFTFLHISSLKGEHKNFSMLLKAFAVFENKEKSCLWVINSGDEKPYLSMIKDLGISENVKFFGKQEILQVANQMQVADAFVLSSNFENMPCVIAEALCVGLPVVSTDVGGISEIISDTNGVLVEKGNTLEFAKALDHIVENYENYEASKIAKEATAKFSKQAVLVQMEKALDI